MCRLCRPLLVLLLTLLLPSPSLPAEQEARVALVVGIGSYAHAPQLGTSARDAQAMAEALGRLGFKVDLVLDPDFRQLGTTLREFGYKAADSDLTLIYFAGYGLQIDGQNFLVPADARLERDRDLVYETLPLNLFLGEIGQARRLGIMILDAARDGPFDERLIQSGGARPVAARAGLGRVDDSPPDTIVATATRANAVAEDEGGEHSPYTAALLEELKVPGLELELLFRRVRDRVIQATGGRQEPYTYGSYGATPIYLSPVPVNRPPVAPVAPPVEVASNAGPTPLALPAPTDPDGDQLVVQVIGLPLGGTVMVGERGLLIGDYLTVEQLKAASFKPDGSRQGESGSFDYTVSDGRGEIAKAAVAITILTSNRPPAVAAAPVLQVVANVPASRLVLPAMSDPEGDPLSLRIKALPERGRLRQGSSALKVGDQIPIPLGEPLAFDPENAAPGPAGEIAFTVADGRGGETGGSVRVEILAARVEPPTVSLDEARWRELGQRPGEAELRDFLERFPQSRFAGEARRRLQAAIEPTPRPARPKPAPQEPKPAAQEPKPAAQEKVKTTTLPPDRRCQGVLERAQLGEPLSDADRALLRNQCNS